MNLQNIRVAYKLWAVVLGSMSAMVLLAFGLMMYSDRVDAEVAKQFQRILQRHDLHNTTRTKAAYIERALDLMAKAIPFLNEGRGNRLTS